MDKQFEYIDLYSGCGGLSLGMHLANWSALFAVEKNPDAFETLSYNLIERNSHFCWPEWLPKEPHDIDVMIKKYKKQLMSLRGTVKLVAGGSPCQGFSLAGERDEGDERNKLVDSYLKFVDLVRPESVLFENVKGFTMEFGRKSKLDCGKKYSVYIIEALTKRGYNVSCDIVDFSQFGIPQTRNRFILFASKIYDTKQFFELLFDNREDFLKNKKLSITATLEDAISDLKREFGTVQCPDAKSFISGLYGRSCTKYQRYCRRSVKKSQIPDSHRFAKHKASTVTRFNELLNLNQKNMNLSLKLKDTYDVKKNCITVLDALKPCPTLTSHPDDHIHYKEPRILTVREYARIQSFPDWFFFRGKYTTGGQLRKTDVPRYTQIANAIPPLFAEQVGIALSSVMKQDL